MDHLTERLVKVQFVMRTNARVDVIQIASLAIASDRPCSDRAMCARRA